MWQRVRQVLWAWQSEKICIDENFLKKFLPEKILQEFFFAMAKQDQAHCFRVAQTAKNLYEKNFAQNENHNENQNKNQNELNFLIRCCLLHDIGRKNFGKLHTIKKIFSVLLYEFLPKKIYPCAEKIFPCFFIYLHHAELGAEKLRSQKFFHEADLIEHHHEKNFSHDKLFLLLQQADDLN